MSEKIICSNERFKKRIIVNFVKRRQRYFRTEIMNNSLETNIN